MYIDHTEGKNKQKKFSTKVELLFKNTPSFLKGMSPLLKDGSICLEIGW